MNKKGKNPTRAQKILIKAAGLNLDNWLVVREEEKYLYLRHRLSGKERVILKRQEGKR